jgi:hypothetical protein
VGAGGRRRPVRNPQIRGPASATIQAMPTTFSDLPSDHPIFSTGPSLVFKNDLPPEITSAEDDGSPTDTQESDDE